MSYNHLSAEERGQIEAYLKEGVSQAEIARRLIGIDPQSLERSNVVPSKERRRVSLVCLIKQLALVI